MSKSKIVKESDFVTPKVDYEDICDVNDAYLLLNKTDMILNDNFYIMLNHIIKNFHKDEQSEIRNTLYRYLDGMVENMVSLSPLHRSLSSFYELIFYPLFSSKSGINKKLSQFNIDVKFIKDVLLTNLHSLNKMDDKNDGDDHCIKLIFFKFTDDHKLHEFITKKTGGVRQVYDKNYKIKSIIMADDFELKISNIKMENKNGNKRVSGKSRTNRSI